MILFLMQVATKNRIVGYFFVVHTILHNNSVSKLGFILQSGFITKNFSEPQNPRFIIESGFKSRAGYNGARTVHKHLYLIRWLKCILLLMSNKYLNKWFKGFHSTTTWARRGGGGLQKVHVCPPTWMSTWTKV